MALITGLQPQYADLIAQQSQNLWPAPTYNANDIAKFWDLIGRAGVHDEIGVGSLSWNQLAPQDQAVLSSSLSSDPTKMFIDVNGRTMIDPGAYNVRSVGDTNTVEYTPMYQRMAGYFGNYYSPTQAELLYNIDPSIAAKYGITADTIAQTRAIQDQYAKKRDSAEWRGMDKEAALMAATVLTAGAAGGAFSGAAAGEGAAAGSAASSGSAWGSLGDIAAGSGTAAGTGGTTALTGASGSGYTGTASELAADGLGGVEMGGSAAYYDAGAGMWIDEATGQGIASGASVPTGYTAEAGQIANATANVAPSVSADSWMQQLSDYGSQASDWLKQGNNAQNVANALKAFTQSSTASNGGGGFTGGAGDSFGDYSSGSSGAVNSTNGQSQLLEMPVSATYQDQQSSQQAPSPLGMIDMSSANNTFQQAGSTWNQQMANALRSRNAY